MIWFVCTITALALLMAAGLRAPAPATGMPRLAVRLLITAGAFAATLAANVALYKHDVHLDLTREQAFTPAPETLRIVSGLTQDVELTYFYQKQNPAARAAKTMVETLGRLNPRLHVETVDPDQNPALANRLGVRLYNAALLQAGEARVEVDTTDDREIALGILRLLRSDRRPICFTAGHGEYDIDNFEFHTHFEGQAGHSHDAGGMAVVEMDQHGLGRLRRAVEKLGYTVRKVTLPSERVVPQECATLVEANPRTRHGQPEVEVLSSYLEHGGSLLMLIEPDFPVDSGLAALLARAGIRVGDGVITDPKSHYYTDEQMVAITTYANHQATLGLALAFFPGVRPLEALAAPGVTSTVLFSSSADSRVIVKRGNAMSAAGPRGLAVASEGRLDNRPGAPRFRLAVVGDADFASNSFFPYLSNADLVLGLLAWLRGEERGPAMKPPVEVLPTVALTNSEMQTVFVISVLLLPGLVAFVGVLVWWRRRY